jgi:hypothetical protein
MSMPNTSRLELQRGESIVTPGQYLPSGRSRAWAVGRPDVAFHRVGPIQWGMESTEVGLSRSSTDAARCRVDAAALASKHLR